MGGSKRTNRDASSKNNSPDSAESLFSQLVLHVTWEKILITSSRTTYCVVGGSKNTPVCSAVCVVKLYDLDTWRTRAINCEVMWTAFLGKGSIVAIGCWISNAPLESCIISPAWAHGLLHVILRDSLKHKRAQGRMYTFREMIPGLED